MTAAVGRRLAPVEPCGGPRSPGGPGGRHGSRPARRGGRPPVPGPGRGGEGRWPRLGRPGRPGRRRRRGTGASRRRSRTRRFPAAACRPDRGPVRRPGPRSGAGPHGGWRWCWKRVRPRVRYGVCRDQQPRPAPRPVQQSPAVPTGVWGSPPSAASASGQDRSGLRHRGQALPPPPSSAQRRWPSRVPPPSAFAAGSAIRADAVNGPARRGRGSRRPPPAGSGPVGAWLPRRAIVLASKGVAASPAIREPSGSSSAWRVAGVDDDPVDCRTAASVVASAVISRSANGRPARACTGPQARRGGSLTPVRSPPGLTFSSSAVTRSVCSSASDDADERRVAGDRLDAAQVGADRALTDDLDRPDEPQGVDVGAAAQLGESARPLPRPAPGHRTCRRRTRSHPGTSAWSLVGLVAPDRLRRR